MRLLLIAGGLAIGKWKFQLKQYISFVCAWVDALRPVQNTSLCLPMAGVTPQVFVTS
jgi:hypothetical protein